MRYRLCWLYTTALIDQRVDEHRHTSSSIGKHFRDKHSSTPKDLTTNFTIPKKCNSKFDCLIYEMFFINELRPSTMYNVTQFVRKFLNSFLFILFLYVLIVFITPLNIFMLFTFVTSLFYYIISTYVNFYLHFA